MTSLATDGSTVIKLENRLADLQNRVDSSSQCFVSRKPQVRSAIIGKYDKESAALEQRLVALIVDKVPAKTHVFLNSFGDVDRQIWLDPVANTFSVMYSDEEHIVDLAKIDQYWMESGHML
ncbi:MAG: hypothetical protein V7700_16405 [Halioglobus sp.]